MLLRSTEVQPAAAKICSARVRFFIERTHSALSASPSPFLFPRPPLQGLGCTGGSCDGAHFYFVNTSCVNSIARTIHNCGQQPTPAVVFPSLFFAPAVCHSRARSLEMSQRPCVWCGVWERSLLVERLRETPDRMEKSLPLSHTLSLPPSLPPSLAPSHSLALTDSLSHSLRRIGQTSR